MKTLIRAMQHVNQKGHHKSQQPDPDLKLSTIALTPAYVPKQNPTVPSKMIRRSLISHSDFENILKHFLSGLDQNTAISMRGGKMKERAELAKAPTKVMRSPRSGMLTARTAAKNKINIVNCKMY